MARSLALMLVLAFCARNADGFRKRAPEEEVNNPDADTDSDDDIYLPHEEVNNPDASTDSDEESGEIYLPANDNAEASDEEDPPMESEYKCGAIIQDSNACYPKASSWKKISKRLTWDACTTQCQSGMMGCSCPNKGEHCSSVLTSNPGLTKVNYAGTGHMFSFAVKVDKRGNWEYLSYEKSWEGAKEIITWKWVPPSDKGQSFIKHKYVMAPSQREIKTVIPDAPENVDMCAPEIAAQFLQAQLSRSSPLCGRKKKGKN